MRLFSTFNTCIFFIFICLAFNAYSYVNAPAESLTFSTEKYPNTQKNTLTFYTENYPPSNYLRNNELTGVSVEVLKLMWQKMKMKEQEIYVVPWARGYSNTLHRANSVLFTMARTPQREKLFKWVGPIYTAEHVLVARENFKEKITQFNQAFKYNIAAIKDDISEITLIENNFPEERMALVTHLRQAILLLKNKRIDLMIISKSALKGLLSENNITMDDIKIIYSVNKVGNYFAFNNQTPDALILQYQSAFDAIESKRDALNKSYGLFH